MEIERAILYDFDYVLAENTDDLIESISDWLGEEPNTNVSSVNVRHNEKLDQTFKVESPEDIGFCDFEYYAVRVVESTSAVTEIISVAPVKSDVLSDILSDHSTGARLPHYQSWKRDMRTIRSKIPGEEQGPETSMVWVNTDTLPSTLQSKKPDISDIEIEFQDGVSGQFLRNFNTSISRGAIRWGTDELIFLCQPDQPFGDLVALDIDDQMDLPQYDSAHMVAGKFSRLSRLYAIHYWCAVRGKDLDEIDQFIADARDEFPSSKDVGDKNLQNIQLDAEIYKVQECWGPLYSRISSGNAELNRILQRWNVDFESTSLPGAANEDILESYSRSLQKELDKIEFDLDRSSASIDSVSNYLGNQLSIISSKRSIDLQQQIQDQSESSNQLQRKIQSQMESTNELQSTVKRLTYIVAILTFILVLDAALPNGISGVVSNLYSTVIAHF